MAYKQFDEIDRLAECQGQAISRHQVLRPKNNQLRKTYIVDNQQFCTGNRQRKLCNGSGG